MNIKSIIIFLFFCFIQLPYVVICCEEDSSSGSFAVQFDVLSRGIQPIQMTEFFSDINEEFLSSPDFLSKPIFHSPVFDNDKLNIFTFNVGQGNYILARNGSEIIIIDAGMNKGITEDTFNRIILPKIVSVVQGTKLKSIFVTHPHVDHYSQILNLMNIITENGGSIDDNMQIYLGGPYEIWHRGSPYNNFLSKLDEDKYNISYITHFTEPENVNQFTIFSNEEIKFQFILPNKCPSPKWINDNLINANEFSFLLKISYRNPLCSFLFTGDAEGINITNIIGEIDQSRLVQAFLALLPSSKREIHEDVANFLIEQNHGKDEDLLFRINRASLNGIGTVFIPHHGTDTANSQRVVEYLLDRQLPPASFIVNSVVVPKDNLPHRSTFEIIPRDILHPAHYIVYHNGDSKRIKLTKKRLYVTETAPGGVFWQISDGDNIYQYNAYREDPDDINTDIGFFPITAIKNIPGDCLLYIVKRIQDNSQRFVPLMNSKAEDILRNLADDEWRLFAILKIYGESFFTDNSILLRILGETLEDYKTNFCREIMDIFNIFLWKEEQVGEFVAELRNYIKGNELYNSFIKSRKDEDLLSLKQAVMNFLIGHSNFEHLFGGRGLYDYIINHIVRFSSSFRFQKEDVIFPMCLGTYREEKAYEKELILSIDN